MKKLFFTITILFVSISLFAQKILFIGDSITDGKWGQECDGTRNTEDWNHIFGHGYMYICAAEFMAEYPELHLEFYNRGISGNTIDDVSKRWKTDALDINPDVLTILIGINDVLNNNLKPDTLAFEKKYRDLLTQSRKQNPNLLIIIGEPFCEQGFRVDNEGVARKSCEALARATKRIAADFNAVYLPFQSKFDDVCKTNERYYKTPSTYWIWDGVHPTPAGHYKMAEMWMNNMRFLLPTILKE